MDKSRSSDLKNSQDYQLYFYELLQICCFPRNPLIKSSVMMINEKECPIARYKKIFIEKSKPP